MSGQIEAAGQMAAGWQVKTEHLGLRPWRSDEWEQLLSIRSLESVAKWLGDPEPWTTKDQTVSRIESWAESCAALERQPVTTPQPFAGPQPDDHVQLNPVQLNPVQLDPRWEAGTWPTVVLAIVPQDAVVPVGSVSLALLPQAPDLGPEPGLAGVAGLGPMPSVAKRELEIGWYLHPESVGNGYAAEAATAMLGVGFAIGAPRIWAVMWSHNVSSAGVAERIGMSDLGDVVDHWYGTQAEPGSRMFCLEQPNT